MKHHFLKIDTTTDDPLELALWNAYEYEYNDRLASSYKWQSDGPDYTAAFKTSFTLLLNNKGMIVLREMLRRFELYCIRKNTDTLLQVMLQDLLGDKIEELQLDPNQEEELTLRTHELLETLFKDRYRRTYDQLCTLAITSHLYFAGYEFYSRDLATNVLNHNDPKTAADLIMMMAASGRNTAQFLLVQNQVKPTDPTDSDDISTSNLIKEINYRLATYLVDSATDNYLFELDSTRLDEPTESIPILSLLPTAPSPQLEIPATIAPRPEPPRLIPHVHRTSEKAIFLLPSTTEESAIRHSTQLTELLSKTEILEAQLREAEQQLAATKDDLHFQEKAARHQKYLNSILSQQLAQKDALRTDTSTFPIDVDTTPNATQRKPHLDPFHDLLNQVIAAKLTPAESLTTIEKLLTNHVVILPSAYKSAKESEHFRDRKGCFKLLWRLATDYRTALLTGSGDTAARKVFSYNEFASNDGGAEDRNKNQLRFEYNGEIRQFSKHLKLGFKKSNAETIRIYFDYDPLEQKIILAYCGPHL